MGAKLPLSVAEITPTKSCPSKIHSAARSGYLKTFRKKWGSLFGGFM